VLGEGRLTDVSGRFTDFRSTVIVLTSNLGADTRRDLAGFGGVETAAQLEARQQIHYRSEAQRFFRPELYNRLDDILVFRSLQAAEIRAIVDRELDRVAARDGFRRREVDLDIAPAARELLAARGLDPRYGARPLKRTIERMLVAPIAGWLASHPSSGPVRLSTDAQEGGELALSAASLDKRDDGASRKQIERIVERAARVRAEVRSWARSQPMRHLLQQLSLFDRLSRQPTFWHDRAIADDRARAAAEGRELAAAFLSAEKQAESAEDLAYEAHYDRLGNASLSLDDEISSVEGQLVGLGERLFASMFPPRNSISLTLTAGRTGWSHLVALVDAISHWVRRRNGTITWHVPIEKAAKAEPKRPAPEPGKPKPKAKKSEPPKKLWKWHAMRPTDEISPPPPAAIAQVTGMAALTLLASEHGAHRFTQGGSTAIVKVRFTPKAPGSLVDVDPEELEKTQPSDEIRRVWPDKKVIHDLRLDRRFDLGDEGAIDLSPLLAAYQRWRIFSGTFDGGDEG
jgi:ATP-dependent Clp protease ATP-binding subunit ClpC